MFCAEMLVYRILKLYYYLLLYNILFKSYHIGLMDYHIYIFTICAKQYTQHTLNIFFVQKLLYSYMQKKKNLIFNVEICV